MNVCVAHLQMKACVAKNFGAWTEKVGHPCPTFMAHLTRVGRRVGALHKKLGHPCPRELPGLWGSMVFRHALIPRKGSGKQQQQHKIENIKSNKRQMSLMTKLTEYLKSDSVL